MEIGGKKVHAGEHVCIELEVAKLPTRTSIEIPVFVHRSLKEGPTLLLLGGLHGDEINGMEIARRMLQKNLVSPLVGTIIIIPILNVYGFLNFSRGLPDGKDINRSFPGSPNGSLASRIAATLVKEVLPHVDMALDFHTGGASRSNYPQIRCELDFSINRELSAAFAAPITMDAPLRPNSFRKTMKNMGKAVLVYEGGESMRYDEHSIQEGINGTLRVMKHLGMCEAAPEVSKAGIEVRQSSWIRARASGLFHAVVENGAKVRKQQVLGYLSDAYGDYEIPLKASRAGVVICINNLPVINQGDALIHLAVDY